MSTNPPAFPSLDVWEEHCEAKGAYRVTSECVGGMSLRDYFAAKAMHAEIVTSMHEPSCDALVKAALLAGQTATERIAFNAYRMADAMLKEREK